MLTDLKYEFIRTPLEGPLMWLRRAFEYPSRARHPELREIHLEEPRIRAVIDRYVTADSNCVDIGCHYGSVLSHFCRIAPRGRHVAFEAIPGKVRFLRRKFPDVEIQELALSDRAGMVAFHINRGASGFSGLAPHGKGEFERIEVRCARLDDVLPRDRRFPFVKLDVEGAELFVLKGATEFLARDRPALLFECGPSGPGAFGYTAEDLYDFLTGTCSYSIFFLKDALHDGPPASREAFSQALVYPFRAFNWLAKPSGK
jgi:FkbM family methyltransferase